MRILPICTCISTTLWLHYLTCLGEKKAGWELHKNAAYCFEQIMEAAHYKKQQLYSHLPPI